MTDAGRGPCCGHADRPPELLERLLGFDTQSFRSNLELVDFVRAYLARTAASRARLVHDDTGDQGQSVGGDRAAPTCRASCSPAIPM